MGFEITSYVLIGCLAEYKALGRLFWIEKPFESTTVSTGEIRRMMRPPYSTILGCDPKAPNMPASVSNFFCCDVFERSRGDLMTTPGIVECRQIVAVEPVEW